MDSIHSTGSKARNQVTYLQKAAITSAMASNQVFEWYLPQVEGLLLKGTVPCWSDAHHVRAPILAKPVCCFLIVSV